jgi:small subunit ribosomal protein S13
VFRNLLEIKGISTTLALKICALLGISGHTIYSKLSPHKVDQLNLLLSLYRKKTSPFLVTSNVVSQPNLPEGSLAHRACSAPGGGGVTPPKADYLMFAEQHLDCGATHMDIQNKLGEKILHSPILSNLDEFKKENIKILINLNALRGRRFKQGYPVRGQRTRSNAKTARRLNRMFH